MKRIISLAVAVFLALSCMCTAAFNVSAAGKSVIRFSNSEIDVGKQLTVTVSVNADENMMALQFVLQYDPQILEFVSGDSSNGGAGVISVVHPVGNSSSATLSYTFKALKAGSCYISTSDSTYVNFNESEISVPNQGASVTVKDVTLSGNANLKSLKVSEGKLYPAFSASTTSYSATVGEDVTECKIYATAEDKDAKVQVSGGSDLAVGKNNCTVTVTAANGTQKTYKVVITREEETESEPESSSDESSSEETASDESSKDESSEDESSEPEALDVNLNGTVYTVADTIDNVEIPLGFSAKAATYNGNDVTVIADEKEEYVIYYLSNTETEELVPYILNPDTGSFEKVELIKQSGRYYIFNEIPDNTSVPEGYYSTNTYISDFNVECYSNSQPELSSFYYVYCYNGEDYGFYRYDSLENVLQRYPEMALNLEETEVSANVDESFVARFSSLTTNAKMIVVGLLLVIIGVIALIILLVLRIVRYRNNAKYDDAIDFSESFDDVNFVNKFSLDNEDFLTDNDDVTADLDFGEEQIQEQDVPDYLIDGEPESGEILPDEEVSDYLTDDEPDTEE